MFKITMCLALLVAFTSATTYQQLRVKRQTFLGTAEIQGAADLYNQNQYNPYNPYNPYQNQYNQFSRYPGQNVYPQNGFLVQNGFPGQNGFNLQG